MGNLLFVILSTVSTRGFHIPVSTAQQTQHVNSATHAITQKTAFRGKSDKTADIPLFLR